MAQFVIKHTTNKFISELRNDCSSGFDNIPVKVIKPVAEDITSPIVNIINSSIDKEIFPDNWKVARVCPVPKIVNPINEKDFRPISILPVLSKIYEKVILKQLSTQTILLKFRDYIQKALNKNGITMSVFIDYSKAFDTIQHEIPIKKLVNFNFNNSSIKIILSYLSNSNSIVISIVTVCAIRC